MEKKKGPGGRPTKYKPEYCEQIVEHMKDGKSAISFARSIDVCMATITEWASVHPEFSASYKKAMSYCEDHWAQEGLKGLWNHKDGPTLNTGVWAFYMKARFGWSDKQEMVIANKPDEKLVIDMGDDDN